jgi:hypothetical protein|tara:strand:+ start:610 stop:828 length:219 start_codon:yes stop_codon:yes gene_type:complete
MRLTKYQKSRLLEFGWDIVESKDQNCFWIEINKKQHGELMDEVCEVFGKECKEDQIKLLIVATQESNIKIDS